MAALLQQMAVLQVVPDAADADDPDAAALARLATVLAPDETQLLYSIVLHGRAEIALAPDEYSGLVMVLLRLLAFPAAGHGRGAIDAGAGRCRLRRALLQRRPDRPWLQRRSRRRSARRCVSAASPTEGGKPSAAPAVADSSEHACRGAARCRQCVRRRVGPTS